MSNKRSIKGIAAIILILANIAVIIALVISIKNAVKKIETGQTQGQDSLEENKQEELLNQEFEENEFQNTEEQEENKITVQQVISQLNNQNTSILEIILVLVGVALFIVGVVLLRLVKKMS